MNCKNCTTEANESYCPKCGQPTTLKRINGHYIIHEIEHVLHFERGILFTVKELIIAPGETVRKYILENRSRLVKPIIFIIITSLIYSIIGHFFHLKEGYMIYQGPKNSTIFSIFEWIKTHYGYANIMVGAFVAFWAKLLFKKYQFNYFEILILLCFVVGMSMLLFAVFGAFEGITHIKVMQKGGFLGVIYITWAIGQFFDKTKAINYLKAFGAYILGTFTFAFAALGLGSLIDLIIKY